MTAGSELTEHAPRLIEPVGDLLAVDPGAAHPAAALFRGGKLIAAERVVLEEMTKLSPLDRSVRIAHAVLRWVVGREGRPRYLVCEWPQVYRPGKGKGDPNDLILIAGIAGSIAGALAMAVAIGAEERSLVVSSPTPGEWAGQVPKSTTGDPWASARGIRIRSRLSDSEALCVVPSHDAVDAVGIGLYALGRFERRRVYGRPTEPTLAPDDGGGDDDAS